MLEGKMGTLGQEEGGKWAKRKIQKPGRASGHVA